MSTPAKQNFLWEISECRISIPSSILTSTILGIAWRSGLKQSLRIYFEIFDYLVAYLKATIIDNSNCGISEESYQVVVKAISVLCCTIPSVFTRRCLAAVEVKNMTMKTMNIFLNILLTSDADIKYSHVFIRDFRPFCFVLQTNVLKTISSPNFL